MWTEQPETDEETTALLLAKRVESGGSDFDNAESISELKRELISEMVEEGFDDAEVTPPPIREGLPMVARRAEEADEATAEAALSRRSEVLNAGEKTREVSRTENCSSTTHNGEPSGTRLVQSVSNRQRSLILFSIQLWEFGFVGETS